MPDSPLHRIRDRDQEGAFIEMQRIFHLLASMQFEASAKSRDRWQQTLIMSRLPQSSLWLAFTSAFEVPGERPCLKLARGPMTSALVDRELDLVTRTAQVVAHRQRNFFE